jgi:hypothetical protein
MADNNKTRSIIITDESGDKITLSKDDFVSGWVETVAALDYLIVERYNEEMRSELEKIRITIKDMAVAKFNDIYRENNDDKDSNEVFIAIVIHKDQDVVIKEVLGVFYDKLVAMDAVDDFVERFEVNNNRKFNLIEVIYQEHLIS